MTAEYVRGRSELARMYRRNIVRYCELAQVLVFRDISMRTRRRFPTLDTVVAAEKDVRIDKIVYLEIVNDHPLPWATEHYENGHWILQQDGAFAHLVKSTQYWCLNNLADAPE
ncbi:hypothetical protein ANCDUO_02076 [Ancylostoma duodenale]|uniref:Bestrophin homolog n=1 Tax=Ancylostoma duodenale TaxID=51022 RepID=A0A0C2H1G3_9BILA|nr:hypothetical protein ANCDUO_02076 [Ancylostoma duodenale]